jgi:hypothetical protein
MAVQTEPHRAASLVMFESDTLVTREAITIVSGAGVLRPGTVLGKITSGGKYKPATATGSDGAQVGAAILLYAVDATSADAQVAAIVRGDCAINGAELVWGSTVDDSTKRNAKIADLRALGVIVR